MGLEIWKNISGYENLYQVSNQGNVRNIKTGTILKRSIGSRVGYYYVGLHHNKKTISFAVHKLVAMAFLNHIPDGTNKIVVDHINENPLDNRVENLQLLSNRENITKKSRGKSKYPGVNLDKGKWRARIYYNGKRKDLGLYKTELEAHQAYKTELNKLK